MRIADMNWREVERYLRVDDRCVIPIGSTEQHAQLSLCVDAILAEKVAIDAAEPLNIPVFPALYYGVTPYFTAFPGTVTLKVDTLLAVVRDIIESVYHSGFRRVLIINGHGGNTPVSVMIHELMQRQSDLAVKFVNWYAQPRFLSAAQKVDPLCTHANWFESFPWTRLANIQTPSDDKPVVDRDMVAISAPAQVRAIIGDGSYGGAYRRSDEEMLALWQLGVEETRAALEGPWPSR